MKYSTIATLVAASAPAVLASVSQLDSNFVPPLDNSILNNVESVAQFTNPNVPTLIVDGLKTRDDEPDPNRNVTLQDGYVFVLQCVDAGFREPCIVFGAPPGYCGKCNTSDHDFSF